MIKMQAEIAFAVTSSGGILRHLEQNSGQVQLQTRHMQAWQLRRHLSPSLASAPTSELLLLMTLPPVPVEKLECELASDPDTELMLAGLLLAEIHNPSLALTVEC